MAQKKSNAGNAYKKKVEPKKYGPSMYDTKVRDQYGKPVVNKPSDSKKKPYGMASKTSDEKKVVKKTSPKKSTSFVDAANDWIDRNFRNAVNKSSSDLNKKIQNKLNPVRKEVKQINTKVQKKYGDPIRKKTSEINKKLQSKVGDPIRKAVYGDKKKDVKKVETKKPAAKKPEIKTKETKPKVVNNNLTTGPTVSQLWQEKTGTSWSEAKKLGLTDGTASSNNALMKKLKSGSVNRNTVKSDKAATDTEPFRKEMEQNVQDELSGKIKFDEPVPTMRRGGSVKNMRKNRMKKK